MILAFLGCRLDDAAMLAYFDGDGDGYYEVDGAEFGAQAPFDCNDSDAEIHPGAADTDCDGVDRDCSGEAEEQRELYIDGDGDGTGAGDPTGWQCNDQVIPDGYSINSTDCDDTDSLRSPLQAEVCDGIDNDCDGDSDDGLGEYRTLYRDEDGDNFGKSTVWIFACEGVDGYVDNDDDCNDDLADKYPGAPEYCDSFVTDCDRDDENGIYTIYDSVGDPIDGGTDTDEYTALVLESGSITFCPGEFDVTIDASDEANEVKGNGLPGEVILHSTGSGSVISVDSAVGFSVQGVTLQGGTGTSVLGDAFGGGLYILSSAVVAGELVIEANSADYGGGVAVLESDDVTLVDLTISSNTALNSGGGVYLGDSIVNMNTDVLISSNTIDLAPGKGGGIYVTDHSELTLSDVEISENTAEEGAGIWMESGILNYTDGLVQHNGFGGTSTGTEGGGIYAFGASELTFSDITFYSNDAEEGAGLYLDGSDLECQDSCLFTDNGLITPTYDVLKGGAIAAVNGSSISTVDGFSGTTSFSFQSNGAEKGGQSTSMIRA